jgi:predicted deacetylase
MITKAKYILRFDDICPTMNWKIWDKIEEILNEHKIKPVMAVIPDVKDEKLFMEPPKKDFWDRVKKWQEMGWTIGLHGYQHKFEIFLTKKDFKTLCNYSEFAGLPYDVQKYKIQEAIKIFKHNGIEPYCWIAPASNFDQTTLKILNEFNLKIISFGYYLRPIKNQGFVFIPQQLWWFMWLPFGLWTICFHHNTWDERTLKKFEKDILKFKNYIVDFKEVAERWNVENINLTDKIFYFLFLNLIRIYGRAKRFFLKIKNEGSI